LESHPSLLSHYTAGYLFKEAIDSALEQLELNNVPEDAQDRYKTNRLCVQCVTINLLLQMADDLGWGGCKSQSLVSFYFSQLSKKLLPAFHEQVTKLRSKVQVKAEETRARELRRFGTGGRDPLEVLQELPEDIRQCFILRDEGLLKNLLEKMDPDEAERIMGRCIDSGLWIPGTVTSSDSSIEPSNYLSRLFTIILIIIIIILINYCQVPRLG